MRRPLVTCAALAALLATGSAVSTSRAGYTVRSTNAANTFATAADWVAPVVAIGAPLAGAVSNDRTPVISGTAGAAAGDATTIVVRVYAGAAATGTPVQTLNAPRTATTWTATAATLADGTYTAQASQADGGGNTGTSAPRTFTVDGHPPVPVAVSAANGGANAGRLNAGDRIAFAFSEAISPTAVLSTFTGGSTTAAVRVRFTNAGTFSAPADRFTILDGAGAANVRLDAGATTGVATSANLVTTTVTWPATMSQSADGTTFTIVLGTTPASGLATVTNAARNMAWKPKAGPVDLAGNALALPAGTVAETDDDVDF